MSSHISSTRLTIRDILQKKQAGEKISMITCYDYTMARIIDKCDMDMILVGDSAANVMCGYDTTLPITLDEMIFFARNVVRGNKQALIVCDMPFGSYQIDEAGAVLSAIRIMKEAGVQAVKIEGGKKICPFVKHLVEIGIPVCGHIGLTPQAINQLSGYGLQGNDEIAANRLIEDARALEAAGCFAIVLEKIPATLASTITRQLDIVTIGIGAGNGTDGQVLVLQDMLGMNGGFKPKFLRSFANVGDIIQQAIVDYIKAVRSSDFPNCNESY